MFIQNHKAENITYLQNNLDKMLHEKDDQKEA